MPRGRGVQLGTIFAEGWPPKVWEGKIRRDFRQLLVCDRKYLPNGATYRKSEKQLINYNPSHVGRRKVGELWFINEKVIGAHVDPLKLHFSTDFISARRGCWPLKFLHALEIDQGLQAHTPGGLTLGSAPYF